ncbi:MAG: hypothetical protein SWO11_23240 [Thermodesulfobacteriota bacterium]|nr:hypothetical protein [Thermodesulfobacteriota bacterium]
MNDYTQKTSRFIFKRDIDSGLVIGPKGCHYCSEAEAMYYDQIGLCGCGQPENVHKFLLDCMAATRDDHDLIIDYSKIIEIVKSRPEVVAEFVLHFLDDCNLTEHGSSVYGSWLTERGKQVLEIGVMDKD